MIIEKTLRGIVLAGAFALPFVVLIVTTSLFFPYITGKNFAFRIIVEIMTGAWLALALVYPKYRPRRTWILGAFSIFVLCIAISNALGVYPFKSFWSNFERMDGWVTLLHVLLYLVVTASTILSEKIWRLLFQVSLGVSVFIGIYGFLQLAGFQALGQGGAAGLTARIDATFGNPIYLAAYMLFHIFIAALLWYQMWRVRPPGKRLAPSIAYASIIALDTIVLFFTGTRGTMLGLIGGAVLSLVLIALIEGTRRIRFVALGALVFVVLCAGLLKASKDTSFVQSIGFLHRLATISLTDSTIKSRFLNMGIAWQGVKERPIFGWGQENYAIVFDKYYDPRMYGQEPWFDRVHDIIFDWLVAGGFVGLLAYLSIFGATLSVIWFRDVFAVPERAILTGLLAGYFFHNLTVFDNITSYILFATILAYIVWREADGRKLKAISERSFIPQNALPFVAALMVIAVWAGGWWGNARALAANKALLNGLTPHNEGVLENLKYLQESVAYGTYGNQEAREQAAQIAVQVGGSELPNDIKQQFLNFANSQMLLQEQASPLDARFPLFRGVLLDAYGKYDDAKVALERALTLSPKKQSIFYELASNASMRGDRVASVNYYRLALEAEPSNTQARTLYVAALLQAGDNATADQVLEPIIENGNAADPRVTAAYVGAGRYDKVIQIWEAYAKVNPNNEQAYFTLAAAYYTIGDRTKAIESLEKAKTVQPSIAAQADALIDEIRKGTAKVE